MAKFELLCSKDDVAAIRIGNSVYYVDIANQHDILIYDAEHKKLNVIVPEYWLPEVTRGEATLAVLKAAMAAYENGFNAGYGIKSSRHFNDFVQRLINALVDPELAKQFLSIFWIELRPFDDIKNLVRKIVENPKIREKTPTASRLTLDRYATRADFEYDKEFSDRIHLIQQEMEEVVFNPSDELRDVLDLKPTKVPQLIKSIEHIIGLRSHAGSE